MSEEENERVEKDQQNLHVRNQREIESGTAKWVKRGYCAKTKVYLLWKVKVFLAVMIYT